MTVLMLFAVFFLLSPIVGAGAASWRDEKVQELMTTVDIERQRWLERGVRSLGICSALGWGVFAITCVVVGLAILVDATGADTLLFR